MRLKNTLAVRGENLVVRKLRHDGFKIIERNLRMGYRELDIIAKKGRLIVVCEVRTKSNTIFYSPAETILKRKIKFLRQATAQWLTHANLGPVNVRFDVAAVVFDVPEGRIEYYENAF